MFPIRPATKLSRMPLLSRDLKTASTSTTHSFTSTTTTKSVDDFSAKTPAKNANSGDSYELAPDHVSVVSYLVHALATEIIQNKEYWGLAKTASVFAETNRAAMLSTLAAGLSAMDAKNAHKPSQVPNEITGDAHYQVHGTAQGDARPDDYSRLPTCGCEFCESLGGQRRDKWGPY